MKHTRSLVVLAAAAWMPLAVAQKWELGAGGGFGFYTANNVANPFNSGSVKITPGVAASGWLANNTGAHWGGELRYDFQMGDLKVSSGSTSAAFSSMSNAVHYDMVYHLSPINAHVRPFVAFGGGMKHYLGTGKEVAAQPLNAIALLTKTGDLRWLASVGGGIKINSGHFGLRIEVHDYLTPFPTKVIAPAQNSKISGLIHDLVFSVGVSRLR